MLSSTRVLIADDDDVLRTLWIERLRHLRPDFHILEAADGQTAHTLYQQHGADVIITDNQMPLMTGTELINILRASGARTPIVLVSSEPPSPHDSSFDAMTVFLCKPASVHLVLTTITQLLAALS